MSSLSSYFLVVASVAALLGHGRVRRQTAREFRAACPVYEQEGAARGSGALSGRLAESVTLSFAFRLLSIEASLGDT